MPVLHVRCHLSKNSVEKGSGASTCLSRFLQCREEWLAELVAELDDSNAYEYIKRLTDVHRLQVGCFPSTRPALQ